MAKPKTETDSAESSVTPRVSVIDRRVANPFGTPSREIPLKGEKRRWVVRTFSADPEHPNRHYDAVHRMGWEPLRVEDLAVSAESIGFTVSTDGRIVRGPAGAEVLMAMPQEDFAKVQEAKSQANLRSIGSKANKEAVAQATAKEHGAEAGEMVAKTFSQQEFQEPI